MRSILSYKIYFGNNYKRWLSSWAIWRLSQRNKLRRYNWTSKITSFLVENSNSSSFLGSGRGNLRRCLSKKNTMISTSTSPRMIYVSSARILNLIKKIKTSLTFINWSLEATWSSWKMPTRRISKMELLIHIRYFKKRLLKLQTSS